MLVPLWFEREESAPAPGPTPTCRGDVMMMYAVTDPDQRANRIGHFGELARFGQFTPCFALTSH
jgi:hypothetical protein